MAISLGWPVPSSLNHPSVSCLCCLVKLAFLTRTIPLEEMWQVSPSEFPAAAPSFPPGLAGPSLCLQAWLVQGWWALGCRDHFLL